MAQQRFFNFQQLEEAWTDAQAYLGILEPARYRGFDLLAVVNTTTITIGHSNNRAIISLNKNGDALKSNTGVWLTKQGVVIQEDGAITVNHASLNNSGGTAPRIFAFYGEHLFASISGGINATYGLKPGDTSGNYPILDFPNKQVILAYITVPAGGTAANATLSLLKMKSLGNEEAAMIDWENRFKMMNSFAQSSNPGTYSSNKITINNLGNTFSVNISGNYNRIKRPDNAQAGLKIVVLNTNASSREIYHNPDTWAQYLANSGAYTTEYDSGFSYIKFEGYKQSSISADIYALDHGTHQVAVFELVDHGGARGLWWHCTHVDSTWAYLYYMSEVIKVLKENLSNPYITSKKITYTVSNFTEEEGIDQHLAPFHVLQGTPGSGEWSYTPPSQLFTGAAAEYVQYIRLTIRMRLKVRVWGPNSTFDLYLAKNRLGSIIDPNDPTQGCYLVTGIADDIPRVLNASIIFKAQPTDYFEIFVLGIGFRTITYFDINDITSDLTYEPINRFIP